MFLDTNREIMIENHTHQIESEKYMAYWEGLIFIKGIPSGAESVRVFLREVHEKKIHKACGVLSGNFCCVLYDKLRDTRYAFIDNDGLSRLFYNHQLISSSFLALISRLNLTLTDLNPFSIIEFIQSGRIFGSKPFFNSVNILSPHEILVISDQDMKLTSKSKDIERVSRSSHEEAFLDLFTKIVASLRNRKLKLHLTGGSDSRLLTLFFKKELGIVDAFTVGAPGNPDVEIAKKLSEHMKLNHQIFYHPVSNEKDTLRDLEEIFETFDGLFSTPELYQAYHSHQRTRHCGTDLVISGKGGELYKLSAYHSLRREKRGATIERLVRTGSLNWCSPPYIPSDIFSDRFRKHASDYMPWLENILKTRFRKERGRVLEDKINYEYSVRGDYRLSNDTKVLRVYAPLLDKELVSCAQGISGFNRLFSNFHRKMMNSLDATVSQIETTNPRYGYVKGINWLFGKVKKRIQHKTGEFKRLVGCSNKSSGELESNDWSDKIVSKDVMNRTHSIYDLVRNSRRGHEQMEYLKLCGILKPDIPIKEIDNLFYGRLFTVAQLLQRIKQ